ncbi:major facilitator superfamily domain-containing protein [Cercophora newfieldiana]|uniref:Major facilitator superfamily domain-containing protein n=1 Tax=Cercophora newfieldiana TaxID=92897 RepID=A0AA39Y8W5_9PEZI|nr:major facilitator superfamily domain-containing protein [Cercophora newfieldiana]
MFGKRAPSGENSADEAVSDKALQVDGAANLESGIGNGKPEVICPPHTTEAHIKTRIDYHILPFVCILYLLAFLDRVNVGNARAFNLQKDLGLDPLGTQFNTVLTIFFIPYIIFEIPSNIYLKRFSPRIWLSVCCIGFGLVTMLQGFTQNYGGILATRFFLGVFECGMFPGCFYLISMWYKRDEAQKRYTLFFSSTSLAGAFGGLLASAIGKMDGIRGYSGWRWIFILEGLITLVIGVIFLFTFPSFPEEAKWLTEDERVYVKARLEADQGRNAAERKITWRDVIHVMKDYKIWLGGFMYFGMIVPAYGYAYFSPTIIQSYHYDAIQTQLRSVPPWAASFGFAMMIAALSDWNRHRFLYAVCPIFIAIAGFAILINVHDNINLQYAALFLVCLGTYSAMPIMVCWFSMNLGGHHRRAIGTAWQIGFGNIGGIIATYSFLASDAVNFYRKGYIICLAFISFAAASCIVYAVAITYENKEKEKALKDAGMSEAEKEELGDLNPEFKYML